MEKQVSTRVALTMKTNRWVIQEFTCLSSWTSQKFLDIIFTHICIFTTYLCWTHARQSDAVSRSPPQSSSLQKSTPCAPPPQQHGWLSAALLLGALTSATFHAQAPPWLPVLRPSLGRPPAPHQANTIQTCERENKKSRTLLRRPVAQTGKEGGAIKENTKGNCLSSRAKSCSALLSLTGPQASVLSKLG